MKNGKEPLEVASQLAEKYPADRDTVMRAIHETVEHVKKGYPVPTGRRILVEDWEDFVIIHAHFGSLTNRALAQLIGHILSEQTGYSVVVQHDPYRIFVHTMGAANADRIMGVFNEMKQMDELDIRDMLTKATVKTGLFKRRMVHVARRFGALKKRVDLSRVTLQKLMKSFEGTAIYDEGLKETFTKDLDLERVIHVLNDVKKGEIEVAKLETEGVATPVARVGIERVSMKTDLIPPERLKLILVESARARLLNEVRTFVCTDCWEYLEMIRMKDLPEKPACPRCGSSSLGVLRMEEDDVQSLVDKRGEKLTKSEEKMKESALKTASLMSRYGKPAAAALSGRKLRVSDVEEVLKEERTLSDRFFELVIEAERNALKRRFW